MTQQTLLRRRGSYGIGAPNGFAFMAVMTVFFLVLAVISGRWQRFVPVTIMVTFVGLYLDATLRGKFLVWAHLLDSLGLRGDERILDLGVCWKKAWRLSLQDIFFKRSGAT
jgi:arsenite methyltransferase